MTDLKVDLRELDGGPCAPEAVFDWPNTTSFAPSASLMASSLAAPLRTCTFARRGFVVAEDQVPCPVLSAPDPLITCRLRRSPMHRGAWRDVGVGRFCEGLTEMRMDGWLSL